jgi:hypothetical protein
VDRTKSRGPAAGGAKFYARFSSAARKSSATMRPLVSSVSCARACRRAPFLPEDQRVYRRCVFRDNPERKYLRRCRHCVQTYVSESWIGRQGTKAPHVTICRSVFVLDIGSRGRSKLDGNYGLPAGLERLRSHLSLGVVFDSYSVDTPLARTDCFVALSQLAGIPGV